MITTEELKDRVDRIGDVLDVMSQNFTKLTEMVVEQRREMAELRQQTADLSQQTAELRQLSEAAQKQLDNHQQQLIELRRDSQKTRRLWIAVARQLDWLDLDEDFD